MNEQEMKRIVQEKITAAIQENLQEYIGCKSTQKKRDEIILALQTTLDRSYGVGYATVESMEVDGTTTTIRFTRVSYLTVTAGAGVVRAM
jgi:hypothetical protein